MPPVTRLLYLRIAVALSAIAGMALSYKLWLSTRFYPQTPVFPFLKPIPSPFDWILFAATDILADDWEVEEQKVEINRLALCSAWVRAHCGSLNCDQFEGFARELGFK